MLAVLMITHTAITKHSQVFGDDETLKQSRKRAKGDPRAEEQFGVRVGKLGQGFII